MRMNISISYDNIIIEFVAVENAFFLNKVQNMDLNLFTLYFVNVAKINVPISI